MTVIDQRATHRLAANLDEVTLSFGDTVVLDRLSLQVNAGEIVAIVGRSGSGKSTILRVLAGLTADYSGTATTAGPPAIAFQEPRLFPWRSVRHNVIYGANRNRRGDKDAASRADAALTEVGLHDKAGAWPLTLSGGQAQRVSLARALVAEPSLLLLDEPFGALDALTRRSMHQLLIDVWSTHHFGALLVTHDVHEAVALADRVVVLANGRIETEVVISAARPRALSVPELATAADTLLAALGI